MAILAAAPALGAIGALTGAAGTIFGGVAQSEASSYQAAVANNNAIIARQNAAYAEQAGEAKQQQVGLQSAEQGGQIKTALAANDVDVNTGSAENVEIGQREKGELSQETTINNAELQAYGYQSQATGFEVQAGLDQAAATVAPIGATLTAGGSLLSNASATKWLSGLGGGGGNPWSLDGATAPGVA